MSSRSRNSRFKKFKPGERNHITIVGESAPGQQILACGICGERWPPPEGVKGRARFAHSHWMIQHVKCKEKSDG